MGTATSTDADGVPMNQREARRRELLDAADRVVRRDGPSASMDCIAAEAGITKPILYRHFGDKGDLYRLLAERYVEPVMRAISPALHRPGDVRMRLRAVIDAYLAFIEADPQIYRFLMHCAVGERDEARATVSEFIVRVSREVAGALWEECDRVGVDRAPAETWGYGLVGMVQVASDWWLQERPVSREDFVDHLAALAWRGLSVLDVASVSPRGA